MLGAGVPGVEANPSGRSRTGVIFMGMNLALVEHLLGRAVQSQSRHQVLLRIIFHYLVADSRIVGYFRPTDERRTVLLAYPDDYRAATANTLCFPRLGLRLNKYQVVWREGKPYGRRCALVAVFADRRNIENTGT